ATGASTTPSTTGPYAPCPPAPGPGPTTTNTAPPATRTTTPSAPSPTASWASCTAAYVTTPSTANTPPGHIAKSPKPLDELGSWDVYMNNDPADDDDHAAIPPLILRLGKHTGSRTGV